MENYNTSKDYKRLWELASKGQEVICEVKSNGKALCKTHLCDNNKVTVADGSFLYIWENNSTKKGFIKECRKWNLEFILPNAWVSVKERLPEKMKVVITHASDTRIDANMRLQNKAWFRCTDITHWMPLPEPPSIENVLNQ